jgi:flagellar basal body-associated protein FliL
MKNPIKIVKIIVILAVIVVLSLGVIAIINQFSLSNYEISKSPLFESPQIQKEPAKVEPKVESVEPKVESVEPKVESVQTDLSIKTNSQSVFLEGFQDS